MLILSGVSGSGKTFFADYLCDNFNYTIVPSITTRKPRQGEIVNKDRKFCSIDDFRVLEKSQNIKFCKEIYGNFYGFDLRGINTNKIVFQLKYYFINEFKCEYKNSKSLYIKPSPINKAKKLLADRCIENRSEHENRVNEIEKEIRYIDENPRIIDYIFQNDYTKKSELKFMDLIHSIHEEL